MLSSPVEEIKSRLDLVEIITGYIPLKQAGANFKGVCPFHKEKSPSFMVSKDKQIWHCFGCSLGGDVFSFVMQMEGLEFPEALRLLAAKAGVKLEKQDPQIQSQRNTLYDICEVSADFFHELLLKHPKAEVAREYIKKRGLKPETVRDWKIGYSPDSWDVLFNYLRQKGFKAEDIFLAGLAVKKDRGAVADFRSPHGGGQSGSRGDQGSGQTASPVQPAASYYDRFRHRLMFPINDPNGSPVGFTARVLDETRDKMGKYINTPQTPIYDKSRILYGLDKAKTEIRKQNLVVMVEGQMDCIASHEAGVTNVVASSGTAMTPQQVTLLKRYTENLALSFDADAAGENAALRGIEVAQAAGLNIKVVTIPDGKDPDDCIRHNPDQWTQAIKNAQPIMEYFFTKALQSQDITQAEAKKGIAKFLLSKISKLPDTIEQAHYIQKLSAIINVDEKILRAALPKTGVNMATAGESAPAKVQAPAKAIQPDRHKSLSETFLALLSYTNGIESVAKLPSHMIAPGITQDLYKTVESYYNHAKDNSLDKQSFWTNWLSNLKDEKLINYYSQLTLFLDKEFDPGVDHKRELETALFEIKKLYLERQRGKLSLQLRQADGLHDKAKADELSVLFDQVSKDLNNLQTDSK